MCPSIECPRCGHKTYHRGVCEHEGCDYAPQVSFDDVQFDPRRAAIVLQDHAEKLMLSPTERPFPMLRVESPDFELVTHIAGEVGYVGPIFTNDDDIFRGEVHGFDFVKDRARQMSIALT